MSYYPTNFYSNYPYGNNQYQTPMTQQFQPQPQITTGLQGKIVESEDMARVADVPMGGYGIFPKADLSEVYIKMWNGNGTTSLLTFQPVIKQEPVKEEGEITSLLLERIKGLEEKIDKLVGTPMLEAPQQNNAAAAISKRKEF